MIKNIVFIFLFSFFSLNLFANADSLLAISYKEKAIEWIEKKQRDSSDFYKNKADQLFLSNRDTSNWIYLHQRFGIEYRDLFDDYESAFQEFSIILEAEKKWNHPLGADVNEGLGWTYFWIGHTYKKLNDQKLAAKYFTIGASIFRDRLGKEDFSVAYYFYSQIGNAYNRLRDYKKAELYHIKNKNILIAEERWPEAIGAFSDLGLVYLNWEKFPKAIEILSEGLLIKEIDIDNKILLLTNLADAYLQSKENEKALFYIEKCKSIIEHSDYSENDKKESLIWPTIILGNHYRSIGEFQEAENQFNLALEYAKLSPSQSKRNLSGLYINKGQLSLIRQNTSDALTNFQKAIVTLLLNDDSLYSFPTKDQLEHEPNLIEALGGMARAYVKDYKKDHSPATAEKAMQCFDLATYVESLLLQDYILEGSKMTALKEHHWLKEDLMSFSFEMWKQDSSQFLAEKMFRISEKNHALLMMENVDLTAAMNSGKTNELRNQYVKKNNQIDKLNSSIFDTRRTRETGWEERINLMNTELADTKDERTKIIEKVEALHPGLNLLGKQSFVSILDIQKTLDTEHALVEYFLTDKFVFTFIITSKKFDIKKSEWNSEWGQKAMAFKDHIFYEKRNAAYIEHATSLYNHLVHPISEFTSTTENLIIIPDGELWNIPFDALLTKNVKKENQNEYKNLPYLIKQKNISYPFSATLLFQNQKNNRKISRNKFMGFAPSYFKNDSRIALRNNLDTLIYNEPETKNIYEILGNKGELVLNSKATKELFLQKLTNAQIVHIAGHAKANLDEPDLSYIAFSNTGDTMSKPYKLYAYELYNKIIPAEMIMLSACETGTGPITKGEGVISLARAFAFSGAQSIITTKWSIPASKSTKDIVVKFYEKINEGKSKDQSLREAKLWYIEHGAVDDERAHPRNWAAFTPLGNMVPIEFESASWNNYLLGAIGFVFIGAFFWYRKSKN